MGLLFPEELDPAHSHRNRDPLLPHLRLCARTGLCRYNAQSCVRHVVATYDIHDAFHHILQSGLSLDETT